MLEPELKNTHREKQTNRRLPQNCLLQPRQLGGSLPPRRAIENKMPTSRSRPQRKRALGGSVNTTGAVKYRVCFNQRGMLFKKSECNTFPENFIRIKIQINKTNEYIFADI